jgi:dihydrofolate reductase
MSDRKIIASLAASADGYIARPDGGIDWLNRPQTAGDYGMSAFFKSIDTIVFGRKTYDISLTFSKDGKTPSHGSKIKSYVFTHNPSGKSGKGIEFVNEPVKDFAQRLRALKGKDIWMMGGGELIASFFDAGEIDEFIIHVMPTFIREGIPLIAPGKKDVELSLIESHQYEDGVLKLHYEVQK